MGQITKHFKKSEFVVSAQFPKLAAKISVTDADKLKFYYMAASILEPVREFSQPRDGSYEVYGKITSGKRSGELNTAVGGCDGSEHLMCYMDCAVDFYVYASGDNDIQRKARTYTAFRWLLHNCLNSIGQVIWSPEKGFIHVSLVNPRYEHLVKIKE